MHEVRFLDLRLLFCAMAQLVEQPPVKRKVPGSNPGSTVMEMIRIGKGPTLKVGAAQAVAGSSPCHLRHGEKPNGEEILC